MEEKIIAALIPTWLQEFEKEAGYMSKQEKIREGIAEYIEDGVVQALPYGFITNEILFYLYTQGMVIKMEGELPECPYRIDWTEYEETIWKRAQQVMLQWHRDSFEPLIRGTDEQE